MVKASSQIEKELAGLQQRTKDMAEALEALYQGYLNALAEASKQQLMAAAYHLCTQAYPDKFLSLSWQQRNQLQKSLQKLAAQIRVQLTEQQKAAKKNSRKPQKNNGLAFLQRLLEARASGAVIRTKEGSSDELLNKLSEIAQLESDEAERPDSELTSHDSEASDWDSDVPLAEDDTDSIEAALSQLSDPIDKDDKHRAADRQSEAEAPDGDSVGDESLDFEMEIPAAEQRLTISEEDDLLSALEALANRSVREIPEEKEAADILAPVHLAKQQVLIENAIRDVFKAVSQEANELLQKANVMPGFPKALMAVAADSRGLGEPLNAVPNVVKVSVRVMHGEANFDMMEDDSEAAGDAGYDAGRGRLGAQDPSDRGGMSRGGADRGQSDRRRANRKSPDMGRSRRIEGRGHPSRRGNSGGDERRSQSRSGSSSAGGSAGGPSDSRRALSNGGRKNGKLPRRFIPPNAIEIEAFPEFAVINLQLSEVEFTDPRVSVWRNRLQKELSGLKQLGVRYQKTQRSLETAKAEDAWRSSWTGLDEP